MASSTRNAFSTDRCGDDAARLDRRTRRARRPRARRPPPRAADPHGPQGSRPCPAASCPAPPRPQPSCWPCPSPRRCPRWSRDCLRSRRSPPARPRRARYFAQNRRQSVHAPRRSPRYDVGSIGPARSWIAGTSADAAPISCAGTVLSQPPTSTTASIGCARIISSTSIDIRLRNIMLVGLRNTSPSEIVGKSIGRPPAASTPRFTASTSSGK